MSFLQLVRREMHGSLPKLLFMSALGGISTAAILGAINAGLQTRSSLWAAMLFIVALFLFIKTQYYVTITTTAETDDHARALLLAMGLPFSGEGERRD